MSKKRKGTIATLIGVMLLSAACSSNSPEPSASAPAGSAAPPEAGPVAISIMAKHDQPEISVTDERFIGELEKKNNVELSFEIPPVTGYAERLQLMLASGEYPDVVFFDNTTDQAFQNAVRDGIIIPINDYLESEDNLNKYTYQASWDQLKVNQDGNIYGIPRTSVVRNDGFWIR
ncbi:MAG: hypothetical protein K0Q63_3124, partial [Paenibacillus sp.]|nr:hypothetical protein [Paenibacillus sp.]